MPLSPMMQKYVEMKEQYKDYILMYRLGDFYEMFFDDAIIASRELEITLTGRDCGLEERAPMCGVPYHSVDGYIARLVQKGYKVSICEQVKDEVTNEVTDRKIVRMVTPGTITDPQVLDETKNSYIACAYAESGLQGEIAVCYSDITTGEILFGEPVKKTDDKLLNELTKLNPSEIYLCGNESEIPAISAYMSRTDTKCIITAADEYSFVYENALAMIKRHMGTAFSTPEFKDKLYVSVFGGLLEYLYRTQLCDLSHLKTLTFLNKQKYMDIDWFSWRNLELTESMRSKSKRGSLLGIIDKTQTPMGARLLRRYLEKPLIDITEILKRQSAVTAFYNNDLVRTDIRDNLANIKDIERLISKVVYGTVNPRDVKAMGASFAYLPEIKRTLTLLDTPTVSRLNERIDTLTDIAALIESAIVDEPPVTLREGKAIRPEFNEELSELKSLLRDSRALMAKIEADEKERTGIKTLKIGYNKVFGYYIEVSKSFSNQVPPEYIRKQTLVNGERYITAELKDLETKLLTADENVIKLENAIFEQIKSTITDALIRIKTTAEAIAELDVYTNFAEISKKNGYSCPVMTPDGAIEIKNGRHPVVEKALKDSLFVPNDAYLDNTSNMLALITGPNMAGKSTYMRQVAVIVVMAQTGCYVPAEYAKLAVVDKIFTRVGASDDLAAGQSTFMVEMSEVAYILKNATKNSLLIFDEIGRGTSTFDGMSVAQAVIEHVVKKVKAKTMFATHYHELTRLDKVFDNVKNYNVAAKKKNNEIIFLRKILKGGTDDSYGIDVAKLAGVPNDVIKRAEEILKELEENKVQIMVSQKREEDMYFGGNLFSEINNEVIEKLRNMDVTTLTPLEAMNELYKLSNTVKSENI